MLKIIFIIMLIKSIIFIPSYINLYFYNSINYYKLKVFNYSFKFSFKHFACNKIKL